MLKTEAEIEEYRKEISDLALKVQQFHDLYEQSHSDLIGLKSSRQDMLGKKQTEIHSLLDSLPVDLSAKGTLDAIYKLKPDASMTQLNSNIEKLEVSSVLAKRKHDQAASRKSQLENLIHQNEINIKTTQVFEMFYGWIKRYRDAEDYFYNDLLPAISAAYDLDMRFHLRSDDLKLSQSIKVAIDSFFKPDSFDKLNMFDAVSDIARLGDAYGERLLDKAPGKTERHPLEDSSYFGITPSERTDSNY